MVAVTEDARPVRDAGVAKLQAAVERAVATDQIPDRLPPLTKRQTQVAYLVSRGLSNKAIGGRLSLSPRTVENHLFNIMATLDFDSRTQIAAWVARRV